MTAKPFCASSPEAYTFRYERRPWSLNVERQGNRWKRAALVKEWRAAFADLAAGHAPLRSIDVTVFPELKNRSGEPDTGACIGAAKAAIDGLVDAGVIPEDGPRFVTRLSFLAPVVTGVDALVLQVAGEPVVDMPAANRAALEKVKWPTRELMGEG